MTVYYKMRQILLQNATAILLQNATEVYYKICQVFFYKMRQFYYKIRQLLQIAMTVLQNATVITKCDVYYKLQQYKDIFLLYEFFIQYFSGELPFIFTFKKVRNLLSVLKLNNSTRV